MAEPLNVVFGASSGLGGAVVRALAAQGKRVRAVNRSGRLDVPGGVETEAADAGSAEAARHAGRGAAVIFHCANPPYTDWARLLPSFTRSLIGAAAHTGAKLVVGDNLYMYGPVEKPLTEDLPSGATGKKGRIRAQIAQEFLAAHREGEAQVTIGRASDFYGPGVVNAATGSRVFRPALEGGTIQLLGGLDQPHTYSFIDDVARGLIKLSEREEALGEVWHIPSAETLTTREFLDIVFEEAGRRCEVRTAPRWLVTALALVNPMMRELKEALYQWERPFAVDHSKFERTFGAPTTPHREAIRATLEWYRQRPA